ncbi:MAG: DUF1350 family protein [Synechococcus sp. ELA619]
MSSWQQQGSLWCLTPPQPQGLVEFIGGSYLAASPQLSYRRLLEALARRGLAIRAFSYVPGFDHQDQANGAWKAFRRAREAMPLGPQALEAGPEGKALRLGHSLGCKLHLLAPDNGRGSSALVSLSFNNFSADRSIPLLAELAPRLGFSSEFSPSPSETLRLVASSYRQSSNLLIRFRSDQLDQSPRLLAALQERATDQSQLLELPGDHLTPASAGFRQNVLGAWADDPKRRTQLEQLADRISGWPTSP